MREYLEKKNIIYRTNGEVEEIYMDNYVFYIRGNSVYIPIPLPTGKESLDDLVTMGVFYARASRLVQGLKSVAEYRLRETTVEIVVSYGTREELEHKLINALEGIESLRYFM